MLWLFCFLPVVTVGIPGALYCLFIDPKSTLPRGDLRRLL